ncbi:MAG: hypothetical protein L0170_18765 [Acidobacteria bacterium]|nr:hypothetical protein [Acidobacteriota bacterium]
MRLEIDTHDRSLLFAIMEATSLSTGQRKVIPGVGTIVYGDQPIAKAFGLPQTIELVLTFGTGVTSGVVANWLFRRISGRAVSLRIERREVAIEEGKITRVIEEIIERSE